VYVTTATVTPVTTVHVSVHALQDYTEALKQKVVKLEAMAARNSNDKVITAQVCLSVQDMQSANHADYIECYAS